MNRPGNDQPIPSSPDRTHWTVNVHFLSPEFEPLIVTEATRDWRSEYKGLHSPGIGRPDVTFTTSKRGLEEPLTAVGILWEAPYARFDRDYALVHAGVHVRDLLARNGAGRLVCRVVELQTIDLVGQAVQSNDIADVTAEYLEIDASLRSFREISPEDFL